MDSVAWVTLVLFVVSAIIVGYAVLSNGPPRIDYLYNKYIKGVRDERDRNS